MNAPANIPAADSRPAPGQTELCHAHYDLDMAARRAITAYYLYIHAPDIAQSHASEVIRYLHQAADTLGYRLVPIDDQRRLDAAAVICGIPNGGGIDDAMTGDAP